jgi:CBS domain-containing protein
MRCEELMKRNVECISPTDTAQTAARKMRDGNVGFLPVCDASGKVLGTLTDRDIAIRLVADGAAANKQVADVMTREVISCRPEDDIQRAEEIMGRHHKSRIMCLDQNGRPIGVISLSDIAQRDNATNVARTMRDVTEREVRA